MKLSLIEINKNTNESSNKYYYTDTEKYDQKPKLFDLVDNRMESDNIWLSETPDKEGEAQTSNGIKFDTDNDNNDNENMFGEFLTGIEDDGEAKEKVSIVDNKRMAVEISFDSVEDSEEENSSKNKKQKVTKNKTKRISKISSVDRLTKKAKERREAFHKVHLLTFLAHGIQTIFLIHNEELMAAALSIIPNDVIKIF